MLKSHDYNNYRTQAEEGKGTLQYSYHMKRRALLAFLIILVAAIILTLVILMVMAHMNGVSMGDEFIRWVVTFMSHPIGHVVGKDVGNF